MLEQYSNIESGDGFIHQILQSLWKVDQILKKITFINIPDTILFQNGGIYSWYFSMDSQVYFKKKQNLEKEQIINKFSTNIPPCGIVAVWIYKKENTQMGQNGENQNNQKLNKSKRQRYSSQDSIPSKKSFSELNQKENNNSNSSKLIYEYMNLEQLNEFLIKARPGEMIDGVLQKFIQPKGDFNSVIQVTWNKEFYLAQKISNPNLINLTNLDIYQRVITFESDNQSITTELKGYAINEYFQNKVQEIVKHIENTYEKPISISLFKGIFKIDAKGKVWFLQCKTISVTQKSQSENRAMRESKSLPFIDTDIPEYINKVKGAIGRGINLQQKEVCMKCLKEVEINGMYEVEYDHIIKSWQFDHVGEMEKIKEESEQKYLEERERLEKLYKLLDKLDLEMPQDLPKAMDQDEKRFDVNPNYIIPRVIRNLEPDLEEEKYLQLVNNPGFRSRKSPVCENCCLHIMNSINWKENPAKLKIKALNDKKYFGVGQLKPEIIIARYNKTRKQVELKKIFEEELNPNSVNKEIFMRFKRMEANQNPPEERTDYPLKMTDIFNRTGIKQNRRHQNYLNSLGIFENNTYLSKISEQRDLKNSFATNPHHLNTPSTLCDDQANSKMSQANSSQFGQKNSISSCQSPSSVMSIIQESGAFTEPMKVYAKTLSKSSLQKFLIPIDNKFKILKEKELEEANKQKKITNSNQSNTQESESAINNNPLPPIKTHKNVSVHRLQIPLNKSNIHQTQPSSLQILTDRAPTSRCEVQLDSILTSRSKDNNEIPLKQNSEQTKTHKKIKNKSDISCLEGQIKEQDTGSQQENFEKIQQIKFHKASNKRKFPPSNLNQNNLQAYLTAIVLPGSTKSKSSSNQLLNPIHFKSQSVWQ